MTVIAEQQSTIESGTTFQYNALMSENISTEYVVTEADKLRFWRSFVMAVEAEPRDATQIRGASGLMHPVLLVGVDDVRRRIIVISSDPEPRSAALSQFDIQSANPGYCVALARPIAINFAPVAAAIVAAAGTDALGPSEVMKLSKAAAEQHQSIQSVAEAIGTALRGLDSADVDLVSAWQGAIRQLADVTAEKGLQLAEGGFPEMTYRLSTLAALDPMRSDRVLGNCPVPLYDFEPADAEVLQRSQSIDAVRDVLRRKQVLQYFFPPPDHLVLGFTEDRPRRSDLTRGLNQAPLLGHPLGEFELLAASTRLEDVIDALTERHMIVEGEVGYELSSTGRNTRGLVKFKPREGVLAKLSRILAFKVDLNIKDLFR